MAIVGHLHHGKTSLMDYMVGQTHIGKSDPNKELKYLDYRKDEIEKQMSIKAAPMSLIVPALTGKSYLFNMMDTPGHLNLSDEYCAAMRLSDGVVIVVDAAEGVMAGTQRLLRYAVMSRMPFVVCINKMDRLIMELNIPPADAYQKLKHTLEDINMLLGTLAQSTGNPVTKISPELGNVCFASAMMGWSFTLASFAQNYADQ